MQAREVGVSGRHVDTDRIAAEVTRTTAAAAGFGVLWLTLRFPMLVISMVLGYFVVGVLAASQGGWSVASIAVAGSSAGLLLWWLGRQAVLSSGPTAGWLMFLGIAAVVLVVGILANNANGARIQQENNQRTIEINRYLLGK